MFENLPRLNGTAIVEFIINGSSIIIEVDGNNAPITAGNFVDLVERGIYDGIAFHRVEAITDANGNQIPFVAQGGDPQSLDPDFNGTLGTGGFIDPETGNERNIPLEIKLEGEEEPTYSTALGRTVGNDNPDVVLEHDRGSIAMARSGDPDSASSQFYFGLTEEAVAPLDGDYAVFGYVTEGLSVMDDIEEGDRISDAEVISGSENLEPGEPTNTIDLFRFRNTSFTSGTYLFVGAAERNDIQNNSNLSEIFALEGEGNLAFKASRIENVGEDELLPFYRLRSLDTEGTYLFVSTKEYDAIFAQDSAQKDKWEKEGFNPEGEDVAEFYLYGADAGKGIEFHRFQNNQNNTFLFAGPEETEAINNDSNLSAIFTDQGVAFEALI
jgi:peptidyl-prolyl cis-trans isomerase B (cyclophilin B)